MPTIPTSARMHAPTLLAALSAALYPTLVAAIVVWLKSAGSSPQGVAAATLVALSAGWGVVLLSFKGERVATGMVARALCCLAFTTPTLLVALNNVAGLFGRTDVLAPAWLALWAILAAIVILFDRAPSASLLTPTRRARLAPAHGISALAIILLFVAPHLGNHLTGLWSGSLHIAVMDQARRVYRTDITQPLLLVLIAFQIVSGLILAASRIRHAVSRFDTLQAMTGLYVAVFFLGHMTAVFAARAAATDTNWNWLTSDDCGLLFYPDSLRLVAHYWIGPLALVSHIACGLRAVLLAHGMAVPTANRAAIVLIGLGGVMSSAILLGLLGVHLG